MCVRALGRLLAGRGARYEHLLDEPERGPIRQRQFAADRAAGHAEMLATQQPKSLRVGLAQPEPNQHRLALQVVGHASYGLKLRLLDYVRRIDALS